MSSCDPGVGSHPGWRTCVCVLALCFITQLPPLTGSSAAGATQPTFWLFTTNPKSKSAFTLRSCNDANYPGNTIVQDGLGCAPARLGTALRPSSHPTVMCFSVESRHHITKIGAHPPKCYYLITVETQNHHLSNSPMGSKWVTDKKEI